MFGNYWCNLIFIWWWSDWGVLFSMKSQHHWLFRTCRFLPFIVSRKFGNRHITSAEWHYIFGKVLCCVTGNWSVCLLTLKTWPMESLPHLLTLCFYKGLWHFSATWPIALTSIDKCSYFFSAVRCTSCMCRPWHNAQQMQCMLLFLLLIFHRAMNLGPLVAYKTNNGPSFHENQNASIDKPDFILMAESLFYWPSHPCFWIMLTLLRKRNCISYVLTVKTKLCGSFWFL